MPRWRMELSPTAAPGIDDGAIEMRACDGFATLNHHAKRLRFEWMPENGWRSLSSVIAGLDPQVGFTRLAACSYAELGQARVSMQSIFLAKRSCEADGPPNSGSPEFVFFMRKSDKSDLRGSSSRVTPKYG